MRKINLFYLIDGGNRWGGAESNLLSVAKRINGERYNVEIGCLVEGRVANIFRNSGLPVTVINMQNKWDMSAVTRLVFLLKRKKIDILHTCLYPSNTFGRIAAILARTKVNLIWEQNIAQLKLPKHVWVDRILNKFTDEIVAISSAVKRSIVEVERIGETKINIVYNSVEPTSLNTSFNNVAKKIELGLRPEDRVLPYVASLGPRKGHKYFLPAIREVVKVFPDVKFLLIGEGPFKHEIEREIEKLDKKENVILCGFRRDIQEILSIAEFYVHPAVIEALGVAILEAMCMGKAVVANRVDGIPEVVVEGETGLLVPPKDPEAMSRAIIELLKSPSRAKDMGQKGKERVLKHFSAEKSARELEKIYEKFILAKVFSKEKSLDEEVQRLRSYWMKEFFTLAAGRREKWFASSPILAYEDKMRQRSLLELVRPTSGERILEVGCGDGRDIILFSLRGARCTGVDYDHKIVTVAKERLAKNYNERNLTVADATKLPFKDCSFDKVSCSEVLEHIPEYKKALKEISRVLRPGGQVAFTVPNRHSLKGIIKGYHSFINRLFNRCDLHPYDEWKTRQELKVALRESGLEVKEEMGVDFTPRFFNSPTLCKIIIKIIGFIEDRIRWWLPGWGNTLALTAVKAPNGDTGNNP